LEVKSQKRILITGASGFVGFHLASKLSKLNSVSLLLVDNLIRGENDQEFSELCGNDNVSYLFGDLKDPSFVANLPHVDTVFHLAALNGTQNFYSRPWEVFDNSIRPTILLLEKYGKSGDVEFIYTGTSESYADAVSAGISPIPTPETTPVMFSHLENPRWSYGFAKTAGEVAIHAMSRQYGLKFQILRLHNLYGPRMGYEHVIPDLIRKQLAGSGEILGSEQSRSFMYISDAIEAIVGLSLSNSAFFQTINVGSPDEIKILDLAKKIAGLLSFRGRFVDLGAPPGSVERRIPDLTKISSLITPGDLTTIDIGLEKTIAYFRGLNP
jgi:nucleoside-diphosphate-sugar epimerase